MQLDLSLILTFLLDQMSRISLINYFGNDGPLGFLELENADEEEVSLAIL